MKRRQEAGPVALRLRAQRPEPSRLWIRYVPSRWKVPTGEWLNLASAELLAGTAARIDFELPAEPPDDVLYLPIPASEFRGERDALLEWAAAADVPTLVQARLGEEVSPATLVVHDVLPELLGGEIDALSRAPRGSVVAWPLISGLTDGEEISERGLEALAAAGVRAVHGTTVRLSGRQRRELAERGLGSFDALFHAAEPDERAFARRASEHALAFQVDRPLPVGPPAMRSNRQLAAVLSLVADLLLRLGRHETVAQEHFRAARWIDASRHDVAALHREGNLAVVAPLDTASREIVAEVVESGASSALETLRREYAAAVDG